MKRKISLLMITLLLLTVAAGCGTKDEGKPAEKTEITFAEVGWDSIKLNNAIAGLIAERVFGYTWQETPGSTPISHEALVKGEVDVHMEEWTDNIPSYIKDRDAGKLTELGVNFDDNYQGLYIPKYIADEYPDLKTVRDLANFAHLFPDPEGGSKGIIYGGIVGWEITDIMARKVHVYGLDEYYNYVESGSDAITNAAVTSAWDKKEPIVFYYWEPTWLLGKYDFVLLEDEPYDPSVYQEGKCGCPSVNVTIAVSNAFAESNPEFCEFLSRYSLPSAIISEALAYINDTGADYSMAAIWLLTEAHPELISDWLTEDQLTAFTSAE